MINLKKKIAVVAAAGVLMSLSISSVSAVTEVNVTDASEESFICQSDDIIKVIENNEETYYFADLLGRQILVVSGKPQNDDEIIRLMEKANANIHYAYIEYNDEIVYYNYKKGSALIATEYKLAEKYIINLDTLEIIDNNNTVLQDLKKNNQYFTITRDVDGKIKKSTLIYEGHQLSMGIPFISPASESMTLADVNVDDKIDVSDVSLMSLYLIGDKTFDNKQLIIADVDGDGTVTLADLARLQQYLSKKITSFWYSAIFILKDYSE